MIGQKYTSFIEDSSFCYGNSGKVNNNLIDKLLFKPNHKTIFESDNRGHFILMMEPKRVEFNFGEVVLKRNTKSKYLRIKVHPDKGVIVSMPLLCSEKRAIDFIQQKENWIRKSLARSAGVKQKSTVFTEEKLFRTKFNILGFKKHNRQVLRFEVKLGNLTVFYPEQAEISDKRIQDFTKQAIIKTLKFEAKEFLPKRTNELADELGFKVSEVKVRNNKTRWGSCSGKNNISLNIHLLILPDKLIDYVIVHELVHTKIKNHSSKYWDYLEKKMPGAKILDKKLNDFDLLYW
jgi:predicted metal-dependent hydrolase